VPPRDVEEVREREFHLESTQPQLMHDIHDTVLHVDRGEAEDEGWDCVEEIAGIAREFSGSTDTCLDLYEDLVVGTKTGLVAGHSFFKEVARLELGCFCITGPGHDAVHP